MNLYNHTTCDQPPLLFFFNSPHLRPSLLSIFDSSSPISGRHHEKRGRKQEGSGRNQLPTSPAQDHAPNFLFCRGFGPAFLGGHCYNFLGLIFSVLLFSFAQCGIYVSVVVCLCIYREKATSTGMNVCGSCSYYIYTVKLT